MLLSEDREKKSGEMRASASLEVAVARSVRLRVSYFHGSGVILGTTMVSSKGQESPGVVIATAAHNIEMAYETKPKKDAQEMDEYFVANLDVDYGADETGKTSGTVLHGKADVKLIRPDNPGPKGSSYDALIVWVEDASLFKFADDAGIPDVEDAVAQFSGGVTEEYLKKWPVLVQSGFGDQSTGESDGTPEPLQMRRTSVKSAGNRLMMNVTGVLRDKRGVSKYNSLMVVAASAYKDQRTTWDSSWTGDSGGPVFACKNAQGDAVICRGIVAVTCGSNVLEGQALQDFPVENNGATLLGPLYQTLAAIFKKLPQQQQRQE
jgi:hypothetical protein